MFRPAFLAILAVELLVIQALGVKQESAASSAPSDQEVSSQRICGCDELHRCHSEQSKKDQSLLAGCRQECGSKIFLNPTSQKVVQCFNDYDRGRSASESQRQQCLEGFGVRQCQAKNAPSHPQTVTINTTEFLRTGSKHNGIRKIAYPDSINSLHSCAKTCVKNQGVIQFNPDGTIVKPSKQAKTNGNAEKNHKNGKSYSACASQLGCQLAAVDKKLEKQAKQLCRLQSAPEDDCDQNLCICLEKALGQNLHCGEQTAAPTSTASTTGGREGDSCPSDGGSCSESRKKGSRN